MEKIKNKIEDLLLNSPKCIFDFGNITFTPADDTSHLPKLDCFAQFNPLFDRYYAICRDNYPNLSPGYIMGFTRPLSYAIPTMPVLNEIIQFSSGKLIEIGCGSGYWLRLLATLDQNGDYIGVDTGEEFNHTFYPVITNDGVQFLKSYDSDGYTLFFCWPRCDHLIFECLEHFKGNKIIFIGERDGCTADPVDSLLEKGWKIDENAQVKLTSWPHIWDQIFFFDR